MMLHLPLVSGDSLDNHRYADLQPSSSSLSRSYQVAPRRDAPRYALAIAVFTHLVERVPLNVFLVLFPASCLLTWLGLPLLFTRRLGTALPGVSEPVAVVAVEHIQVVREFDGHHLLQ